MMNLAQRFDMVILDWAGTMVDFGCQAPVTALIAAFDAEGIALSRELARRDMGRAKSDHVRCLFADPHVADEWAARHGRTPDEAAIEVVIERLTPLMHEHAARACALIPGARATFEALRATGLRVASSTGYTRDMLEPVLAAAALQGYTPEHVVCAGETARGRPSPLMIYKACAELGVWPLSRVVKVDDAVVGIQEGTAAGAFTVGVASGNTLALDLEAFTALPVGQRDERRAQARQMLAEAGADLVIDSVAELVPALQSALAS